MLEINSFEKLEESNEIIDKVQDGSTYEKEFLFLITSNAIFKQLVMKIKIKYFYLYRNKENQVYVNLNIQFWSDLSKDYNTFWKTSYLPSDEIKLQDYSKVLEKAFDLIKKINLRFL